MREDGSIWEAARTLWIKYCGISDEYKMLRDRWLYLYEEKSLPILPYLRKTFSSERDQTFDILDKHVKKMDAAFSEKFSFNRPEFESFAQFSRSHNPKTDLRDYKGIEHKFFDLSTYTGLLKLAFFQRTVSSEIPHVVSGLPHSPERTIGNELFYLAADKIGSRYSDCLNLPYGEWDKFITFVPPVGERYFYGAFCKPSPYLKLFHISLSEEKKYFIGGYLAMAHEFGHAPLSKIQKIDGIRGLDRPNWFKILCHVSLSTIASTLENFSDERCSLCPIYQIIRVSLYTVQKYPFSSLCEQFLADIFALRIGGPNTIHTLIDDVMGVVNPSTLDELLRIVTLWSYTRLCPNYSDRSHEISNRIKEMLVKIELERSRKNITCPTNMSLVRCLVTLGSTWATTTDDFDRRFHRRVSELIDKEILKMPILRRQSFFSRFIRVEFKISHSDEDRIKQSLLDGKPCINDDPAHILHAYYEAYKESVGPERPNYAATIQSLAFNDYRETRKM
jgi:hypothetical protein